MSDIVKAAIIMAGAAVTVAGLFIYFSPFQTCVRAEGSAYVQECALRAAGGR